jgi:uncharacterized repeat protein (TIGR03803 family)
MKTMNVGAVRLMLLLFGGIAGIYTDASAQTLTTLYSFHADPGDGAEPSGRLIADAAGNLYGTTFGGGGDKSYGTIFKLTPTGTEIVLHRFSGYDGAGPEAGLIADAAGNLYGTTKYGGINFGTVFKLTLNPDGTYTHGLLHSFTGYPNDGTAPDGLIADAAGSLYGTTTAGGASSCGGSGCGTVFRLTKNLDGTYTEAVLHSFTGSSDGWYGGTDGQYPFSGLIADGTGNFYGTTHYGGGGGCDGYGCGTVFRLAPNPDGTYSESVIYSFNGDRDGAAPYAGLIADAAGNLYGTTSAGGGARACLEGCGTVFKLTANPDGTFSESVLHRFAGESEGQTPFASLIADGMGNLYGTTYAGGLIESGCAGWCGTVFVLTPTGTLAVLHRFSFSDGANPFAGLMADAAGNLYGTSSRGGTNVYGTVFKQTVSATFHGVRGMANCTGQSISFFSAEFGGIGHAATALGFSSVTDLKNAVAAYCGGQ